MVSAPPSKYRTYVLSVDIIYSLCPVLSSFFFSIFLQKMSKTVLTTGHFPKKVKKTARRIKNGALFALENII